MANIAPRWIWLTLGTTALVIGLSTVVLTAWLHLDPCHLCIFQRLLMLTLGLLALGAALAAGMRLAARVLGGLSLATAVAGVMVAAQQSWIQLQPPGSATCVSGSPGQIERFVEWLGQEAPSLFLATGFCEDDGFRLLGLTLANWSLVCFMLLVAVTAWALWKSR